MKNFVLYRALRYNYVMYSNKTHKPTKCTRFQIDVYNSLW